MEVQAVLQRSWHVEDITISGLVRAQGQNEDLLQLGSQRGLVDVIEKQSIQQDNILLIERGQSDYIKRQSKRLLGDGSEHNPKGQRTITQKTNIIDESV